MAGLTLTQQRAHLDRSAWIPFTVDPLHVCGNRVHIGVSGVRWHDARAYLPSRHILPHDATNGRRGSLEPFWDGPMPRKLGATPGYGEHRPSEVSVGSCENLGLAEDKVELRCYPP